jgi:hypothetical protein
MNAARWVEDCCTQAIYESSRMGIEAAAANERTVAGWNIMLRANREHFPLPDPKIHKQQRPLPDLLENFHEEITLPWVGYCNTNFVNLTVESARNELIIKIIPKCSIQSQANEDDDDEENYERSSLTATTAGVLQCKPCQPYSGIRSKRAHHKDHSKVQHTIASKRGRRRRRELRTIKPHRYYCRG